MGVSLFLNQGFHKSLEEKLLKETKNIKVQKYQSQNLLYHTDS